MGAKKQLQCIDESHQIINDNHWMGYFVLKQAVINLNLVVNEFKNFGVFMGIPKNKLSNLSPAIKAFT
ncbi:hypothetical protein H6G18_09855 [Anabaena subtropica FACHB-260]|uniref:Transposase n=1 Tax=Anabaena subtropica FACHB-260 TaxID=2692884 RepID=A0ABR8CMT0_9NOST|nr:hypothetical protein [Anabaena subtropica FACHB-260]